MVQELNLNRVRSFYAQRPLLSEEMITSLSGELIERTASHAIVECCGVGYLVNISLNTYGQLPESGTITILCHFSVSVDVRSGASTHKLFGFSSSGERELFRRLISVSGVSSTLAMVILSSLEPEQLQRAVLSGDAKMIGTVKGIGPKLAERIIVELRDKMGSLPQQDSLPPGTGNSLKGEALSALSSLGVDHAKAERTLQGILESSGNDIALEELIRAALKEL